MFRFPRTNFHELNLDWILSELEKLDGECAFVTPEDFPESENPVQDCLDYAHDNNKIVLLSNTYDIYHTLTPGEGCVIYGINGATLVSHAQDYPGFVPVTIFECPSNFYVSGVTFDGNRPVPSQSVIPSDLDPTQEFHTAPLIFAYDKQNINFTDCRFTGYDSNRSTSTQSYNYAIMGITNCYGVYIGKCRFVDNLRECIVINASHEIRITDCYFNQGDYPGDTYTEIGVFRSDDVKITDCTILKSENVTSSLINAMSDNITISGCYLEGVNSNFGLDYGNEVEPGFSNDGLFIFNNVIKCHIWGATTYTIDHNNIKIINNQIDATNIASGSGVIAVYGSNDNSFEIYNNHFFGTTLPHQGIRIGDFSDLKISIIGNTFEGPAIWISKTVPPMYISNNWFKSDALYQAEADANSYVVSMLSCKCDRAGRFGVLAAGNEITVHLVGCDFRRSICTNAYAVYDSLSYIRGV